MIGKLLTGAGRFVKIKDLKGYISKLKNKKDLTSTDKKNIAKAESFLEDNKIMGKNLSPDAMMRMNKGGAVKKTTKKKKARTGIKVRGTKFKGIF
jgi:hypothetical protein